MTRNNEPEIEDGEDSAPQSHAGLPERRGLANVPAVIVISLYMFLLAGMNVVSVAKGFTRPAFLIFSAVFLAAAMGLLMLFKWAWTLTLAAVVLLSGLFFYRFTMQHDLASIMQGGLNLVVFFYLVRPEVRANLR
jgi:fatty acid desaturase